MSDCYHITITKSGSQSCGRCDGPPHGWRTEADGTLIAVAPEAWVAALRRATPRGTDFTPMLAVRKWANLVGTRTIQVLFEGPANLDDARGPVRIVLRDQLNVTIPNDVDACVDALWTTLAAGRGGSGVH